MKIITKKEKPITQAVLSIKHQQELDFISQTFEEIITDSTNYIKIDFINGKSFLEDQYSKRNNRVDKLFIEFFDLIEEDIMTYLLDESKNFRVTDSDGTIVRPSIEDYNYVIKHKSKTKQYDI